MKLALIGTLSCVLCAIAVLCVACVPTGEWAVTLVYDTTRGTVDLNPHEDDMIYLEGTVIEVTVTPNAGYKIQTVYLNGTPQTLKDNKFSFTIIENTRIQVIFVPESGETAQYKVNLQYDESKGSVEISPTEASDSFYEGTVVTFTVTPKDGYTVKSVTVNESAVDVKNDGTFDVKMDDEKTVSVEFEEVQQS